MGEEGKEAAKNRKRKEAFVYGNYRNYYGYRIDRSVVEDPRLEVLKKEWFEGKDCLDIGCNQGLITISIAKKFCCQSILGIDIDAGLIETAKWNLRKIARIEIANSRSRRVSESEVTSCANSLEDKISQASDEKRVNFLNDTLPAERNLVERVSFQKENFVESLRGCSEKYDTVLCLSLTKWIHLNWGDDGLITLFVKIWRLLRPGGILILEPQPWTSYKRNRLVSETTKENFSKILLHPHLFGEILLDKVGFRSLENVTENLSGSITGFNRPIAVFLK